MNNKRLSPIVFLPNLVNPDGDGWPAMIPFLDLGAIDKWTVTPLPSVIYPAPGKVETCIDEAILKHLPGKFHLALLDDLPEWLVKSTGWREGAGVNMGRYWKAEYTQFLCAFVERVLEIYRGRITGICSGFEHSVEKLWPHGVKRLIDEISRPVYETVKRHSPEVTVVGFNDTIHGDDINHPKKDHAWKDAIREWWDAGGGDCFDEFGVHLYRYIAKEYDWDEKYREVRDFLLPMLRTAQKPERIWITETGFGAWTEKYVFCRGQVRVDYLERQADHWRRLLEFFRSDESLAHISAYCHWMPADVPDAYGLLTPAHAPRPAFHELEKYWKEV